MQCSESNRAPASHPYGNWRLKIYDRNNLRLLVSAPLRLSVLAMGRRERKRSARLNAGGGEVEVETDCGVREPLDVLLGISGKKC